MMNKKILYLMSVLFVYFKPAFLDSLPIGNQITTFFIVLKIILSLYYITKVLLTYKLNIIDILVFLLLFSQVVSSYATHTLYLNYLGGQFFLLGFYAFLKFYILSDYKSLVQSVFNLFFIFVVIQIITQLFYPSGFDPMYVYGDNRLYFLGRKNSITPYIILILGCFYILDKKMDNLISLTEMSLLSFLGVISFLSHSSTAVLCYLLFTLLRFIGLKENLGNLYTKASFTVYLLVTINILFSQDSVFSIIASLFGKDATFSGRTSIWKLAIEIFRNNFWFGAGLELNFNAWTNGIVVNSAHNTLLDILSRTGIFPGLIFLLILLSLIIGKYRLRLKTLLLLFISFLLYILMENTSLDIFLLLLSILIYLSLNKDFLDEKTI